ncbi:hypothetical protein [Leisingera sp. M523]|uniref:terminase small subunit-like protein n=1 Tax=Leisingera sp. M523 TaxID=2867013 RepID=UPI0021A3EE62|nr:hypothetical protein [Leisingera sp. M523]UWQ30248.1 hypothetical protein K3557_06845 [Leisingera sp. M523]
MAAAPGKRKKTAAAPKRKPGRPSTFTQKVADEICRRMSLGETLKSICEDPKMPTQTGVAKWRQARPEFDVSYARAREDQMHAWADEIVSLIDGAEMGYNVRVPLASKEMERIKEDGFVTFRFRKHHLDHAKAMVDVRKWLMAKVLPAVFGDRLNIDANHTIESKDDAEILQELRAEMERAGMTAEDFAQLVTSSAMTLQ